MQRRLRNARLMYVSATGATEAENLCYMERLGEPGCAYHTDGWEGGEVKGRAHLYMLKRLCDMERLGERVMQIEEV